MFRLTFRLQAVSSALNTPPLRTTTPFALASVKVISSTANPRKSAEQRVKEMANKMDGPTRQDTKTELLRSAERLIAEKGLGSVSVKMITTDAGARNPSAVHYHFGSIESLIMSEQESYTPLMAHLTSHVHMCELCHNRNI